MKNRKPMALLLALALPFQGLAPAAVFADSQLQNVQSTVKTFGGSGTEYQKDMAVNGDGSYVVLVNSGSMDRNLTDVLSPNEADDGTLVLVKYNANHVMQWAKSTHISTSPYGSSAVRATSDGGYLITGSYDSDAYVQKLDGFGEQVWLKQFGGTGIDSSNQILESADHQSYIVIGYTASNDGEFASLNDYKANKNDLYANQSAFIVKLQASNGDIQWKNVLDGQSRDDAKGIIEMDSHYWVIGTTVSTVNDFTGFMVHGMDNNYDVYLAKIDKNTGALQGTPQSFGGAGIEGFSAYLKSSDGGFLVAGDSDSRDGDLVSGTGNSFLAKFDAAGSLLWSTRFSTDDSWPANSIVELSPTQYSVAANDSDGSRIYTIDASDVGNIAVSSEAVPYPIFLFSLAGTPGQWIGSGLSNEGGGLPPELDKGGEDVAILHPGVVTDAEAAAEGVSGIHIQYANQDKQDWVTRSFTVNTTGEWGTDLSWASDNAAIAIDPQTGVATVQQPPASGSDLNVTITVTASRNGVEQSRQLTMKVKKQSSWQPVLTVTEEDGMDIEALETGADGTFYVLNSTDSGQTLEKKGTEDSGFTPLPALPAIDDEYYSGIVSFGVSGADVYVARIYANNADKIDHFEIMKLENDQWVTIAGEVPEEFAPVSPNLGEFGSYSYRKLVVDNGTLYQQVSASYHGGDQGSTTRDLIVKWDGSQWVDVTPDASANGIMEYTVRDGKIYALEVVGDEMTQKLVITNGQDKIAEQELVQGQAPTPMGETSLVVDPDGAIYVLNTYGESGSLVWKGVLNNQDLSWSAVDDSYMFSYPMDLALNGTQVYVLDYDYESGALQFVSRSTIENSGGGENPNPTPSEDNGGGENPNPTPSEDNGGGENPNPTPTEDNGGGENPNPTPTEDNGGGDDSNPTPSEDDDSDDSSETPNTSNPGSSGPTGGGGGSPTSPQSETSSIILSVNGEKKEFPGTVDNKQVNGQNIKTVTVDNQKLLKEITQNKKGVTLTIPVSSKDASSSVVEINAALLKALDASNSTLEVKTDQGTYRIPAKRILVNQLLAKFGPNVNSEDVKLSIDIGMVTAEQKELVDEASSKNNAKVVAPAVSFEVTANYNGKSLPVNSFEQYVERRIPLPAGVDPKKVTTGVVIEPDGTMRHVPTKLVLEDGVYYAQISSLTNSLYSVIWHSVEFSDVASHWAKAAVNELGSRMIVQGVDDNSYEPDRSMTRAEFTAILVRGLGLKSAEGASQFRDVDSSAWYAGSVNAAVQYKLIEGYEEGSFAPSKTITRQEAMAMIARASRITDLQLGEEANAASQLGTFQDANEVQTWAKDAVELSLKAGLVNGKTSEELAPNDQITRAEVAAILERLLKKSNLI